MKKIKLFTLLFLMLCLGKITIAQSISDELPGDPWFSVENIEVMEKPNQNKDMLTVISTNEKTESMVRKNKFKKVASQPIVQKSLDCSIPVDVALLNHKEVVVADRMLASK